MTSKSKLLEELTRIRGRKSLRHFVTATMDEYQWNWHHRYLCDKLDQLANRKIKRLMVFMPPRHGKSQLGSRHFPAHVLGKNPDTRIIACSYSAGLASDMNADCQSIISSHEYGIMFPRTKLSSQVLGRTPARQNNSRFDIVDNGGYYLSAGVGGPITGKGADFAIIDDPVKNSEEAESETYRDKIWKWYGSTLYTRLEKDACVLIIMTRWHEDDLAGRLLAEMEKGGEHWEVVDFPAIKEDSLNKDDPRSIGDALWPDKYDLDKLKEIKGAVGSRYFESMYQQHPSPQEGAIIKKKWFEYYTPGTEPNAAVNFYIDSSYTDKTHNDPSAIIAWTSNRNKMWIKHCISKHMTFPQIIDFLPGYLESQGYSGSSKVYIEAKASGKSIAQELKAKTKINIIEDKDVKDSKITRVYATSATMEAGRVLIPTGQNWVEPFLLELAQFPNGKHDDRVDCLTGAIRKAFPANKRSGPTGIQYD